MRPTKTRILVMSLLVAGMAFGCSSPPAFATSKKQTEYKATTTTAHQEIGLAYEPKVLSAATAVVMDTPPATTASAAILSTGTQNVSMGAIVSHAMYKRVATAFVLILSSGRNVFYPHIDPGLLA